MHVFEDYLCVNKVNNEEIKGLIPLYAMGPVPDCVSDSGHAVCTVFVTVFDHGCDARCYWINTDVGSLV